MDSVEDQEKENKVDVLCSRPPENVKLGSFTSLSCSAAKKRTKKRDARAKLFFGQFFAVLVAVAVVLA